MLLSLVVACLTIDTLAQEVPAMALAYVGQGYNVIIGDPHSEGADPGWTQPIFNASWVNSLTDRVKPVMKCSYDSVTTDISGGKSAQSSMSKDWNVTGSVGLFGWASVSFTASKSVSEMNKTAWQQSTHYFEARAACQLWVAKLPPPTLKYELDPYFVASVASLPTEYSIDAENQIVNSVVKPYGTHFAFSVTSGGMMVQRTSMTDDSYMSYQQSAEKGGWSVHAGAKGAFWIFSDPQGQGGESYNKDATVAFQEAAKSGEVHEFYQGGAPFVDQSQGGPSAWAQGLKDAMVPVGSSQNELVPISSLLTSVNFAPELEPNISAKQAVLEHVMANICQPQYFPGCTTEPKDPLPHIPAGSVNEGSAVRTVCWSPNRGNITTGSADNFVRTWDARTLSNVGNGQGHTSNVMSVTYSPDGKYLASGSYDQTVRIWDTTTWQSLQTLQGHTKAVFSVSYSPDGKYLASGSEDQTVRIWDTTTWQSLQTLGHTEVVGSVSYSPDGKYLASYDQTVRIWDTTTWQSLQTLQGHTEAVRSVSYSPDGKYLASGSADKTIRIWDTTTWQSLQTLQGHTDFVKSVSYSLDGKYLASGSDDKTIRI